MTAPEVPITVAVHCRTQAKREMAIHFAREGARMKWFFWDGIHLHYEMGYQLQ